MSEERAGKKTIDWLLEEENPGVRYRTLTRLLNRPADSAEVIGAKRLAMAAGDVQKILGKQNEDGSWGKPSEFYTDKYRGSVWQLILLAEMGADPCDPRVRRACEYMLDHSQELESGGFSIHERAGSPGGRPGEVIPCLTGNMVFSFERLGMHDDPRVQKGIDWICRYQRCDDAEGEAPTGGPYDRYEMCWGRHSCHMGVVKALKALDAIPEAKRSREVREKIDRLAEYLLIHHIFKRSHDLEKISKPGWLKLGFPLMYQTDVLEILWILADLGVRDGRMHSAVDAVLRKRNENGRWSLENSYNGRMLTDVEVKGEGSKWVTLRALEMLARLQIVSVT